MCPLRVRLRQRDSLKNRWPRGIDKPSNYEEQTNDDMNAYHFSKRSRILLTRDGSPLEAHGLNVTPNCKDGVPKNSKQKPGHPRTELSSGLPEWYDPTAQYSKTFPKKIADLLKLVMST